MATSEGWTSTNPANHGWISNSGRRHGRAAEQSLDEVAGVDEADVDEGHKPDTSMERAGKSPRTANLTDPRTLAATQMMGGLE